MFSKTFLRTKNNSALILNFRFQNRSNIHWEEFGKQLPSIQKHKGWCFNLFKVKSVVFVTNLSEACWFVVKAWLYNRELPKETWLI